MIVLVECLLTNPLPLTNKGGDRKLITQTHRLLIAVVAEEVVEVVVVVRVRRVEEPAARAVAIGLLT